MTKITINTYIANLRPRDKRIIYLFYQ